MLKQRAIWSFTLPVPPTPILNRNVLTKTPSLLGTFYSWESMAMEKFWGSFSWKNSQSFIFFVTLCAQSCLKNCPLGAAEGPCSVGLSLYYSFVKLTLKWPQLPTLGNASPPALAIFLLCTWPFQETSLQRKKANQQGKMDKRQLGGNILTDQLLFRCIIHLGTPNARVKGLKDSSTHTWTLSLPGCFSDAFREEFSRFWLGGDQKKLFNYTHF